MRPTIWLIPIVAVALAPSLSLDATAQQTSTFQVREGGMSFKKVARDVLGATSRSQSGSRAAGLASTGSGGIRIGGSSSVVDVELNALDSACDGCALEVAGDASVFANAFALQRNPNSSLNLQLSSSKQRGELTEDFILQLLKAEQLVDTLVIDNPEQPDSPVKKVQLNSSFDQLSALALTAGDDGRILNSGAHVLTVSPSGNPSTPIVNVAKLRPLRTSSRSVFVSGSIPSSALPIFVGFGDKATQTNVISSKILTSSGGNKNLVKLSVVGFGSTLDPLSGRSASITTSAVSGKSFGSTSPVAVGTTLADIASQYGTTVEALLLLNNLPNDQVDITGLQIEVPADLTTIGFVDNLAGETPTTIAAKFNISVDWLMELNGITDPNFVFDDLSKLQIPGQRPLGSPVLPEALPTNTQLESADYGAYTTFEETYQVQGAAAPLFQNAIRRSFQ